MIVDTGTIDAASIEGLTTMDSTDATEGEIGAIAAAEGLMDGATADASGTTFGT